MAENKAHHPPPAGQAVDASGNATVDPTANVLALVDAATSRQDDLLAANNKWLDAEISHLKEMAELRDECAKEQSKLREDYQEKIAHAESGRLDSIRRVDREDVAKTAAAANVAITTLASQTTDLATTLQKTVAETTMAQESRYSAQFGDSNKRLSAVELALSEGKGKQTVADPQAEKFYSLVEMLVRNQAAGTGKSTGSKETVAYVIAAAAFVASLVAIIGAIVGVALFLKPS